MINQCFLLTVFVAGVLLGTFGGKFYGVAQTYKAIYGDAQHMIVNPVTMKEMK